ncbi:MAG TPA: TetR/AcrR family transcriptional regulator [Terriglobales bacterium]
MFKTALATEKGEQTRDLILDHALKLFRERGIDATTMRDVAKGAGVALGAAYYYFPSKEAIVLAYYDRVQAEHTRMMSDVLKDKKLDLKERLGMLLHTKIDILRNDRKLLGGLFRYTGDPEHPLSVLGKGTELCRQDSVATILQAIGDERFPDDVRQLLPAALWALQMGILLFFIYDSSPDQRRTRRLIDGSIDLSMRLLTVVKSALFKPVRGRLLSLLRDVDLLPVYNFPPAYQKAEETT